MANVDSLSIQITASTASAKSRVLELTQALKELASAISLLDTSKVDSLANSVEHLSNGMSGLKGTDSRAFTRIAKGLKDISTEGETAFEPIQEGAEKVAVESEEVAQSVEKVNEDLQKFDAEPLNEVAASTENVATSIDKTSYKMSAFKSLLSNLKIIIPTEGLDNVNKKISKLEDKIADLKDKINFKSANNADYVDSEEIEKDRKHLQALINDLDRLKLKKQELESHGGFKFGGKSWQESFSGMGRSVTTLGKKLDGLASKFRFSSKATTSTTKSTNDFKLASDKLVKSLTKVTRMLRLMVLRMALRTVIKEVGNGFKSLALHSEEFDKAMSNLRNSAKTLGYSFSAMVAPLIQSLAPALIYLINLFMKLLNAINQVFAALSGSSTWNKAKDFTGKWSDDIKAANKSAKELKKTVLGFDELNQLQEKTSGGGDTSGNIEDMFETLPVEQKWANVADYIKKTANKLFEPIKKAWENVGDFVKKNWKYAMEEVRKLGESVAKDFWEMWNQKATQQIFENILKVIGYIGQAVGNLAKRFREAWEKNRTGYKILCNIRDIVLTITEHLVNMAKATAEWADTLDFSPILTKINELLVSLKPVIDNLMGVIEDFYTTVILPFTKWLIEEGIPKLIQVFIDFNNKVDWDGLREKLKKLWEHLEPFAEKVGEGLIIFIDRVAQALADFINSPEFEKFLEEVEEWMDSVTPEDVADGLEAIAKAIAAFAIGKAVVDGLVAVASFLKLVSTLAPLLKLAVVITVAYAGLKLGGKIGEYLTGEKDTYENFKWWGEGGFLETVFGGIGGIDDVINRIGELQDAFTDMTYNANLGFTILSSTVTAAVNPIAFIFDKITRLAGYRFSWDTLSFEKIGDDAEDAGEALDNFVQKAENAKGKVKSTADEATNLGNRFVESRTKTESFTSAVARLKEEEEGTAQASENLHTSFTRVKEQLDKTAQVTPVLTEKQKGLADAFKTTASVEPTLTSAQKSIADSLKNLTTETDTLATTTKTDWTNIPMDVANAQISMSGTLQEMSLDTDKAAEDVTKSTDKIKKSFDKDSWTFEGVAEGLKKTFEDAKKSIKGVWNSIAEKINGDYEFGGGKFKIKLPTFAYGGFPEDGLFLANHSEMVGQFSNGKTAVANNAEIVEGISQGVYGAVTSAMSRIGGNDRYIANTIVVDGEVIARTITKAQNKQNQRYSPQTV